MVHSITEKCRGCGICAKRCPVSAITGENKSIHTINAKRCVNCSVCGRTCPFGAVLDANGEPVGKVPSKDWPKPRIDRCRCTACSICLDVCGRDALAISLPIRPGDLRVYAYLKQETECVGCGMCEKECPMQAISMEVTG